MPLLKTLVSGAAGLYQFRHLSLQEALAAQVHCALSRSPPLNRAQTGTGARVLNRAQTGPKGPQLRTDRNGSTHRAALCHVPWWWHTHAHLMISDVVRALCSAVCASPPQVLLADREAAQRAWGTQPSVVAFLKQYAHRGSNRRLALL